MSPVLQGFTQGSARQRSISVGCQRAINHFPEKVDSGTPTSPLPAYLRPGLGWLFGYLGSGSVRALTTLNNRAFGIGGANLWEINPAGTVTWRGGVRQGGTAAQIASGGDLSNQLIVVSGGLGYVLDLETNAFTQITDDSFPENVIQCLFFDSAALVLDITGRFYVSTLDDFTEWNALDAGTQSQTADKTIAFIRSHDNLILFGSQNTAIWVNTGSGGAGGYQPQPGTIIEHGIAAPFSAVAIDNTVYYLGADSSGNGQLWRLKGYTPERISTNWFENFIARDTNGQRITSYENALGFGFQLEGHTFYGIYIPGIETTPVYDISTGQWSEWAHWNIATQSWVPFRGINHIFAFGKHLMGDRASGAVYEIDFPRFDNSTGLWGFCSDELV